MCECSICWSNIDSAEDAADLECTLTEDSWWIWQDGCPGLHRSCLSKYLMIQAESGHPAKCPFCLRKLSVTEVYRNLTASQQAVWLRQQNKWLELRAFGRPHPDLAETKAMEGLGYRQCPMCGVWIEKQAAGWITGCDKMTCRCGGRFCFQCGSVEASCDCSFGHDFLDKEMVIKNYSLDLPWPFAEALEEPVDSVDLGASGSTQGQRLAFIKTCPCAGAEQMLEEARRDDLRATSNLCTRDTSHVVSQWWLWVGG